MKQFETFDKKSVKDLSKKDFEKDIFNNEIVWTYLIAHLARNNKSIYEKLTLFEFNDLHSILLESQPLVPYLKDEGNSYLDMALGSLSIREKTESGIQYNYESGDDVCFVEAKYLSDISVKTTNSPIRNQMDRVIENLLCHQGHGKFPNNVVFTLLTPKIFKETKGTRLYSYKFNEYKNELGKDNLGLISKIQLKNGKKRTRNFEYPNQIIERLNNLKMNWVTFEELIEIEYPEFKNYDITERESAKKIWETVIKDLSIL